MNSHLAAAELKTALETAAAGNLPAGLDYLDRALMSDDPAHRLGVALGCARAIVVSLHLDEASGGDFAIALPVHPDGTPADISEADPADTFAARMIVAVANGQHDTAAALHDTEAAHRDFFRYVASMRALFTAAAAAVQAQD